MLLIPDIHINTQYRDQIIQSLSDIVSTHADEDHIVLLGDYVYMFSYDRDALLALYKLLIWRYHEGKTIYVLAWNHDWHGQHFVYEEARQARNIINSHSNEFSLEKGSTPQGGGIFFITTPQVYNIEWESVLMMPYMIDRTSTQSKLSSTESPLWRGDGGTPEGFIETNIAPSLHRSPLWQALTQSTNKYEQASWRLNLTLEHYTQTQQIDTIIHHYYTADTQFPWLRTQFSYRDVSVDPYWCNQWYDVISWHIHHPLIYGRYLCCGSLRTTAANETNQFKYYWIKHGQQIHGYQLQINPHVTIAHDGAALTTHDLTQHRDSLTQQHTQALQSDHYDITLTHTPLQSQLLTMSVVTDQRHDLDQLVDAQLSSQVRSAKPKYKISINTDHQWLQIDTEALQTSVIKRQDTLTDYIDSKYHDQKSVYIDLLEELEIIDKK